MNTPKPNPALFSTKHNELHAPEAPAPKPKKPYVRREHLTQRPFKELAQLKFWSNPNKKAV